MYLSAFVMNLKALFCATCNLYLADTVREFRGTTGYVRAGRMVVLYNLSLLCWLRPENFFSAQRRCSVLSHQYTFIVA